MNFKQAVTIYLPNAALSALLLDGLDFVWALVLLLGSIIFADFLFSEKVNIQKSKGGVKQNGNVKRRSHKISK